MIMKKEYKGKIQTVGRFYAQPMFSDADMRCIRNEEKRIQSNPDGSNTDGSFTMANSSSVFSPYEMLPIAQENKYIRKFSYFIVKLYVVCTHYNRLIEAILITINIQITV